MAIRNVRQIDAEPLAELARALAQPAEMSQFSHDIAAYAQGFYVAESSNGISGYLIMRVEHPPSCVQGQSPVQLWRLFVPRRIKVRGSLRALWFRHSPTLGGAHMTSFGLAPQRTMLVPLPSIVRAGSLPSG